MNKITGILALLFLSVSLHAQQEDEKEVVTTVLDAWHQAAADADFEAYFSKMTEDGVFVGTEAMENWQNAEFKEFSKPYFDKGKAWSFTGLQRNIYFNRTMDMAWFDELLDTQMKLCRGSGVLKKTEHGWKIAHYVLSIAVPNENVDAVVSLKKAKDSVITKQLKLN
ncbi:nuclear transport factor 2 family protein [Sediminicola arcticus]|jgi:ketosteroid isomerase-like protein|uniref:Nuclear transport factor 2 family protein n=1 Tax=Sediminicola arcticus TaxID=1574308 RepID=A0ABV2SXE9_9FLAO